MWGREGLGPLGGEPGDRRVEYVDLDAIELAPRNPKTHDAEGIRRSIGHFGLAELPLLDERTGRLVAGHGRVTDLRASRDSGQTPPAGVTLEDGRWLVPIIRGWASRSDEDAEAYLLASNNLTTRGGWNMEGLAGMLQELAATDADLALLTGWTGDDIDDMLKLLEPPDLDELGDGLGDPDPSDNWPIIRVKVPKHVAAAWRSHAETHNGDEPAALAALLGVDLDDPGASDWTP